MTRFAADLKAFAEKARRRSRELATNVTDHVETSIKVGSPVTGAPGQPVESGALLNSWHRQAEGPFRAAIVSESPYADSIETNERGAALRSSVGGFHSVALTRAGFENVVEHELGKLAK
jgi:hypothetical protein